jgi:lysozyme family protein
MRENFEKSIDLLFKLEGYESDDPHDLGGFTRYGISQKYNPDIDVSKLTREDAVKIYLGRYWIPADCDELAYPFDVVMFIQSVNMGVSRMKRVMTESHGLLDVFLYCLKHYATRPEAQRKVFLTGWCNRLISLWEAIR